MPSEEDSIESYWEGMPRVDPKEVEKRRAEATKFFEEALSKIDLSKAIQDAFFRGEGSMRFETAHPNYGTSLSSGIEPAFASTYRRAQVEDPTP